MCLYKMFLKQVWCHQRRSTSSGSHIDGEALEAPNWPLRPPFLSPRTSDLPVRWSCLLHSRVTIYCSRQAWQTPLSQQMVLLGKQTVVMRSYLSNENDQNRFDSKRCIDGGRVRWRGLNLCKFDSSDRATSMIFFLFQRLLNVTQL